MGKRSNFERRERDFYPTPYEAVSPLIPFLPENSKFLEPCAGNGALYKHLEKNGHNCVWASDIEPQADLVFKLDAFEIGYGEGFDFFITNPPWDRKILHPMIDHFRSLRPTWLLFDADWMHTKQASQYLEYCSKIVSVGRVKWIPDSKMTGKDNCAWYLFEDKKQETKFYGRERD